MWKIPYRIGPVAEKPIVDSLREMDRTGAGRRE
jgi:hypothetical protein